MLQEDCVSLRRKEENSISSIDTYMNTILDANMSFSRKHYLIYASIILKFFNVQLADLANLPKLASYERSFIEEQTFQSASIHANKCSYVVSFGRIGGSTTYNLYMLIKGYPGKRQPMYDLFLINQNFAIIHIIANVPKSELKSKIQTFIQKRFRSVNSVTYIFILKAQKSEAELFLNLTSKAVRANFIVLKTKSKRCNKQLLSKTFSSRKRHSEQKEVNIYDSDDALFFTKQKIQKSKTS